MRTPQRLHKLFVLLALVVVAACSSARHIREAQDVFNRAAQAENNVAVNGPELDRSTLDPTVSVASDYRLALALLDRELSDNAADLAKDRLTGTALMLKALCLWRLEDLGAMPPDSNALDAVVSKLEQHQDELGTRDRVLSVAMKGLRDQSRGSRATDMERARAYFESSIEQLDKALAQVKPPEDHPIQAYVRLAQVRACRDWKDAAERLLTTDSDPQKAELLAVVAWRDKVWESTPKHWLKVEAFKSLARDAYKKAGWSPPAFD